MGELENLFGLQQVDTELFELEQEEESLPLRLEMEELEAGLESLRGELDKLRAELEDNRKSQRQQETRIEDLTAKIKGEEDKLYSGKVANPKELRSIQAEVQSIKRKRDQEENVLLELMEKVEGLEGSIADSEEKEKADTDKLEECRAGLDAELARIAALRHDAEARRGELRPGISPDSLKVYDDLITNRHRVAVVKVVDGACLGCHMSLPAQEHDLFLKSENLFRCSNCRRILVK